MTVMDDVNDMNETAEAKKPVRKKKTAEADPTVEMSFEATMARLETVVGALEGRGEAASLDESLRLYEEGVALVRRLSDELNKAEQRVQILQRTAEGEIKPRPFTSTED